MSRLCTIVLGVLYTAGASLSVWLSWELHRLQQPLSIPLAVSALVTALALYSWSELFAMNRLGRPRLQLAVTLPVTILLFCIAVGAIWPHRRVIAPTVVLDDIQLLPAKPQ